MFSMTTLAEYSLENARFFGLKVGLHKHCSNGPSRKDETHSKFVNKAAGK